MGTVSCTELMRRAAADNRAVPAFNIDNLESALAVAEVMRETGRGVIVQTIPRTLGYGGIRVYPAMMRALMDGSGVDYCMHLDHGNGKELALACVEAGFSSVMFDGSGLPFAENAELTAAIKKSLPDGVSLEAELGAIGGKEETEGDIAYTDPDEAEDFVGRTGCDALAVGVGTAHGVYKGEPFIRVDLIEKINGKIDVPQVLHGASGLSDEVISACIKAGIRKINFATELRQAYTTGIEKGFRENPGCFDPKIYMRVAVDEIKRVVLSKLRLCLGF